MSSILSKLINLAGNITGTLAVGNGGTGQASNLTAGGVLYGASTTAQGCTSAGTSSDWVLSGGTGAPTLSSTTSTAKTISATTDASSSTTGSLIVSGGVGIAKKLYVGTSLNFSDTTQGIVGTTTNNSAGTGIVGQVSSNEQAMQNYSSYTGGSSTAYIDVTSITLDAGDWDIYGAVAGSLNTATSSAYFYAGISTTSGNSGSGLTEGSNFFGANPPTSTADTSAYVLMFRASITGSTTYYLKCRMQYSGGTVTQVGGRIAARRMR